MHPDFSYLLAQLHRERLLREAKIAQAARTTGKGHLRFSPRGFLRSWYQRTRTWYQRSGAAPTKEVRLEELKPAVVTTFSVLYEEGLVSAYDAQFIEQFVETLERELVHQSPCNGL
jgi:hypothetical protein